MAKEDTEETQQGQGKFDRRSFLSQIEAEAIKKERESLKARLAKMVADRKVAMQAVAVIDKQIAEELDKFEAGLS